MNIPEELPTEVMINAGLDVLNNGWYINSDETCAAIFKAMFAAAPTPPAQEDEPVAYKITTTDGRSFQFMIVGHPMEKELLDEAVKLGMPIIPLYTRPDNLRKAAECVMLEWDKNRDIYAAIQILRAALRENYGIQAETQ